MISGLSSFLPGERSAGRGMGGKQILWEGDHVHAFLVGALPGAGPQPRSMLPSVCLSIYLVWASTRQQRRVSVTVGSQTVLGEGLCP